MIQPWQILLLGIGNSEEFSFLMETPCKVSIGGRKINGEWIVSVHVLAFPYFAWGVNNYRSLFTGGPKEVIRYYLALVLYEVSGHTSEWTSEIHKAIKGNLE